MTDNQHSRTGRTFWDWISDNPKTAIFFIIAILLISLSAIYMNKPIEIGPLKINQGKITHDTITKFKTDTQLMSQPIAQIKFNKAPQNSKKEVLVKKGLDTVISVKNQPANINTGTNNGIIGNDNKVNIGATPREFNLTLQNQLLENLKNKDVKIVVTSVMGDQEAFNLAYKIAEFLKQRGYSRVDGVNQSVYTTPVIGQFLTPTKDGFEILIGGNPNH